MTEKTSATSTGGGGKQPASPAPTPASPRSVNLTTPGGTEPKLPNEADETVGSTAGIPSRQVQQAKRDVQRGLRDTSRAPEADAAYAKLKK